MGHASQPPSSSVVARLDDSVFAIRTRIAVAPRVGLVLGSGLGRYVDAISELVRIPYGELPHMPNAGVVGHPGNLCFGKVEGIPVVCMQGRAHLYEGHPSERVVHGVRVMARIGVRCVLLTNAAGALDPTWNPGDFMIVTDHLNLTGSSPLAGVNDESLGPRFVDMTDVYDPGLVAILRKAGQKAGITMREGVYAGVLGPQYETPAEVRMIRSLGASAVGMSTVHEVIALRHMGISVAALSCVTNMAAGISKRRIDHAEVGDVAAARSRELAAVVTYWVVRAGAEP
jgi:purine-nucleoside phosphorylase